MDRGANIARSRLSFRDRGKENRRGRLEGYLWIVVVGIENIILGFVSIYPSFIVS